jgi:hypothetical protein
MTPLQRPRLPACVAARVNPDDKAHVPAVTLKKITTLPSHFKRVQTAKNIFTYFFTYKSR